MKTYLICASLLAAAVCTLAEAPPASAPYPPASGPYPPSGWRPSGRLLVLPARQQASQVYGPPPAEYGPPQEYGPPSTEAATEAAAEAEPTEQPEADASQAAKGESEQLVDRGVYYVLQPDGKLQMVRFTTAPLQKQKFPENRFAESPSNFNSQRIAQQNKFQQQKEAQLVQVQANQAQFHPQPAQFNQKPQPFHYVEIQKSQEVQPTPEQPAAGFVANVQYRDVEPISAPIYAFNPTPLVRILKK